MTSVTLSKKHGLNPAMTYCRRCGGETNEILLLGNAKKYECSACGGLTVGKYPRNGCQLCGSNIGFKSLGEYNGAKDGRLPANSLCDACKEEEKLFQAEVAKGGLRWTCSKCGSFGVIKAGHPFIDAFKSSGRDPKTEGVLFGEFGEGQCPRCQEE